MSDRFLMFRSVFDSLMACDAATCQDVLRMIGDYAMSGKVPESPGIAFAMFLSIRPLYEVSKKRAEAGSIGGKKRAENEALLQSASSKHQANSSNTQANSNNAQQKKKGKEKDINTLKEKEIKEKEKIPFADIVDYLNQKTGKHFRATSDKTRECIRARWNEEYTLDDFRKVIDNMTAKWKGDPKMDDYLRPETLFSRKFESYLNTSHIPQKSEKGTKWNPSSQRQYDFESMEKQLLQGVRE